MPFKDTDRKRQHTREFRRTQRVHDPERAAARIWRQNLARYGLTIEDFDRMIYLQGGVCASCNAAPATQIDHNHQTGRVRALLCGRCNRALGAVDDNAEQLRQAALYAETA